MKRPTYAILPDPTSENTHGWPNDAGWFETWDDAFTAAQDAAESEERPWFVLKLLTQANPPERHPVSLEEQYGLKPGVDFPASLCRRFT